MEDESFGRYISVIYRHLHILLNNRLKPYEVGSGQYIFVSAIYNNPGISQKDLTELIKIDRATTAKALLKLETNGYIDRAQNKDDKRYNKLYLTKKGMDFIPILNNIQADLTNMLSQGMDSNEYSESIRLLKLIFNNVQNSVAQLKND
ncbi:MarR family winged helix-turn-helix transcriptional regulator [Clostridium chromiireducens]|uniref:MarR family transcriptional regulator n=1 Tax=Clostridium chromiireducens TaxID=225345 RepID=A0A1V4IGP4_9CLOT|nr:MarR family transcriptional regulator [Clostridium chromiireducens]MVX65022.1 MarR family transcriptional regulator [Clostridium chromiireducens]OPJ59020.1 transcriptional regulator SlyA [Clostridium chromiireducens]RII34193.1 MarR family transcriptional regulator [Clostridium chromiireducens]